MQNWITLGLMTAAVVVFFRWRQSLGERGISRGGKSSGGDSNAGDFNVADFKAADFSWGPGHHPGASGDFGHHGGHHGASGDFGGGDSGGGHH